MKIIGKTATGYITEVTYNEVKAILSKSDERRKDNAHEKLAIGSELSFTHALERLTLIKDIRLSQSYAVLGRLKEAKNDIDTTIKIIEGIEVALITTQEDINKTGLV